jgi:hypothetical protein
VTLHRGWRRKPRSSTLPEPLGAEGASCAQPAERLRHKKHVTLWLHQATGLRGLDVYAESSSFVLQNEANP